MTNSHALGMSYTRQRKFKLISPCLKIGLAQRMLGITPPHQKMGKSWCMETKGNPVLPTLPLSSLVLIQNHQFFKITLSPTALLDVSATPTSIIHSLAGSTNRQITLMKKWIHLELQEYCSVFSEV